MSGFFNFLKNLFSGILSFFGGRSGSEKSLKASPESSPKARKSKGYFLELEDAKGVSSASDASSPKAPEPETPPQPVAKVESQPKPQPEVKADPQPTPQAKSTATTTAEPVKPEPAVTANALNLPQPTVTFATDYLVNASSSNGRRRPGANMSAYLNMARQVKTSS